MANRRSKIASHTFFSSLFSSVDLLSVGSNLQISGNCSILMKKSTKKILSHRNDFFMQKIYSIICIARWSQYLLDEMTSDFFCHSSVENWNGWDVKQVPWQYQMSMMRSRIFFELLALILDRDNWKYQYQPNWNSWMRSMILQIYDSVQFDVKNLLIHLIERIDPSGRRRRRKKSAPVSITFSIALQSLWHTYDMNRSSTTNDALLFAMSLSFMINYHNEWNRKEEKKEEKQPFVDWVPCFV